MKKGISVALLAVLLLGCNQTKVEAKKTENKKVETVKMEKNGKILEKVGTDVITEKDLQKELNGMPEQYRTYYKTEEGKKKLLERLVEQKLLKQVAIKQGIEKDAEFLKDMESTKERVLASYAIKRNVLDKAIVTDEEIKAFYEKNKENYKKTEEATASHILIKAETKDAKVKAEKVLKETLLEGANFAELAKKYSEGPSAKNGGELGTFGKGKMVKEFEEVIFGKAEAGKVYPELVKTQFGYHIIKVSKKTVAELKGLEEVKEEIKLQLEKTAQKNKYEEFMKKLNDDFKATKEIKKDEKPNG